MKIIYFLTPTQNRSILEEIFMRDNKTFEDIDYMACFTTSPECTLSVGVSKTKTGFEADERSFLPIGLINTFLLEKPERILPPRPMTLDEYRSLQDCINKFDNIHNYPWNN